MHLPTSHSSGRSKASCSMLERPLLRTIATLLVLSAGGRSLTAAEEPVADDAAADFQPGDISIGEPIALPFSDRMSQPAADQAASTADPVELPRTPRFPPQTVSPPPEPSAGEPPLPGNGWLGFVVVESDVAGRWEIDTVAAGGPAAAAGIRPGDEIRAIDGMPLTSSDDVSQGMTAVAPGQEVRLAIARGEQVGDITVTATARPRADRPGPPRRPSGSLEAQRRLPNLLAWRLFPPRQPRWRRRQPSPARPRQWQPRPPPGSRHRPSHLPNVPLHRPAARPPRRPRRRTRHHGRQPRPGGQQHRVPPQWPEETPRPQPAAVRRWAFARSLSIASCSRGSICRSPAERM